MTRPTREELNQTLHDRNREVGVEDKERKRKEESGRIRVEMRDEEGKE